MDVYIIAQVLYLGVHGQAALNHRVARHSASLTKRHWANGPAYDGPGDMREMPKWSLLVLDMYLTTDLQFTRQ